MNKLSNSLVVQALIIHGFRLHGSRVSKEGHRTDADWDFFGTQEMWNNLPDEVREKFRVSECTNYRDQNTYAVYRRPCIDVQIVKDLGRKQAMEDFIQNNPWMLAMPKGARPMLWNYVYNHL